MLLSGGGRPILWLDGGGCWRLDLDPGFEPLLGRRVRVEAVRSGFDLLEVRRIAAEGEADLPFDAVPPTRPRIIGMVTFVLGLMALMGLLEWFAAR